MYVGYRPSQQYRLKYEDIFTTGSQTPMLQITQRQRKNVCLHINHTFRFSGECVICFLTTIYDRIPQGHPCLFSFESKRKYENIVHSPYLETESKTQKTNTIATSNLVPMFLFDARLFFLLTFWHQIPKGIRETGHPPFRIPNIFIIFFIESDIIRIKSFGWKWWWIIWFHHIGRRTRW